MTAEREPRSRVLIIDDRQNLLEAYTFWLEEDFDVYTATTGEAGLALLQQVCAAITLVLVDFHLPGMQGLEVLRQIKTTTPQIIVVTLSGVSDPPLEAEAKRLGAALHLVKPFDLGPTLALLQQLVQTCPQPRL